MPVIVLTHRAREPVTRAATSFTFVTDGLESAMRQAKAAAGEGKVGVMGADVARRCLAADLLDEMSIHLVPVLLGEGVRLFERLGVEPLVLGTPAVVEAPGVTHLRYSLERGGLR